MKRQLEFLCTTDALTKLSVGTELLRTVESLTKDPGPFIGSFEAFLRQPEYAAFRVIEREDGEDMGPYAGGLVVQYFSPLSGSRVLCVEAAWLADDDRDAQEFVWTRRARNPRS